MSHIDEGLIHAHLDGALEGDDRILWTEAAAHLEVCGDCRRRLAEARRLRDGAAAILSGGDAGAPPRPAFEEIAAEAARRAGSAGGQGSAAATSRPATIPWWRSTQRLAWAATVVLALGAGWIGRSLLEPGPAAGPPVTEASSRAPATGPAADALEEDQAGPEAGVPEAVGQAAPSEAETGQTEAAKQERVDGDRADAAPPVDGAAGQDPGGRQSREEQAEFRDAAPSADNAAPAAARSRLAAVAAPTRCYAMAIAPGGAAAEAEVAGEDDESAAAGDRAQGAGRAPAAAEVRVLKLVPDGTAAGGGAAGPVVGFWRDAAGDSVDVRLTAGGPWLALRVHRSESGLSADGLSWPEVACPAE